MSCPGQTAAMGWDGDEYQRRFDALAAAGSDVHGEADFVERFSPRSVLDIGSGTGRVATELARRGVDVVGVDADASMIATARRLAPAQRWIEADATELDLGETFDVVLLAGNVPLFTAPGTNPALLRASARHLAPRGVLVAGFSTDRHYSLETFDADAAASGLELVERFATWDGAPHAPTDSYAVSVHRRRVDVGLNRPGVPEVDPAPGRHVRGRERNR